MFVSAKSPKSATPAIEMLVRGTTPAVRFERVTVSDELLVKMGTLPKFNFVGEADNSIPIPVKFTVCGLEAVLSVMVSVP